MSLNTKRGRPCGRPHVILERGHLSRSMMINSEVIVSVTAMFVEHKPLLLGQEGADLLPARFVSFHQVDHQPSYLVDLAVDDFHVHAVGRT